MTTQKNRCTTSIHAGAAAVLLAWFASDAQAQAPQAATNESAQAAGDRGSGDALVRTVERELREAEGIDGEAIRVGLDDGMIALSGEVDNLLAHNLAVRVAASVRGVRAIEDNITVRPSERSDREVERDVDTALALDPATEHWEIDANVVGGEVTLRGAVDSLAEKSLASRVAESVRGVRAVDNEIVVDYSAERSDREIAHDVAQVLKWNTIVDSGAIDVEVEDDVVRLSGQVDSLFEKEHAGRLAEVAGARDVDVSNLQVRWTREDADPAALANPTDEDLTSAVRMALALDPRVGTFDPSIEVQDGVVTLRGTVDNAKARLVAGDAARDVLGIEAVRNHLAVEPREPVPDDELERRVTDALERSPYVEDADVEVTAVDGEIYLEGDADSWFERFEAGEVAASIAGVVEVHNSIDVAYGRSG